MRSRIARIQTVKTSESKFNGIDDFSFIVVSSGLHTRVNVTVQAPDAHPLAEQQAAKAKSVDLPAALVLRSKLHPLWFIRGLLYLVGTLHTRHQVSFSACALILRCLKFVMEKLPSTNNQAPLTMPTTLTTAFSNLEISDKFLIHPICFNCHRLFETNIATSARCDACDGALFETVSTIGRDSSSKPKVRAPKPIMVSPIQLPSRGLVEFFKRPGMLSTMSSWKTRVQVPGELRCMQDGEVWKTLKGADDELFFHGPSAEDEIRVGVTLSLDWYVITSLKTKYRAENTILCGMTPGPREPTAEQLQNYLKTIVDDLIELYEHGILIESPDHPNGGLLHDPSL
ncbi:hypothetical protein R3P38DRAFT_2518789 [Favolaschia claudopus]|uniref:Uncharacterized protein n=1 Tax=Favolaschia claudopus TaxID=2862362 RepID=A0AAW0C6V3_9AGAR